MTQTELTALQEYYAKLLIYQYVGMPKAFDTIKLIVNQMLCDGLFLEFDDAFNLDTAVGAQLTIIGNIVGVPRNVLGLDLNNTFFNFTRFDGSPASIGFNRYVTPVDADVIARWLTTASYTLNDFEMLALIRLKIIFNNQSLSYSQLKDALWDTFNGDINLDDPETEFTFFNFTRYYMRPESIGFNRYGDPDDDNIERWDQSSIMKIFYIVKQPYYNVVTVAQFLNILPRSMGVQAIVTQI